MVKRDFEVLDHTADIGIVAYGATIKQLFANAALGLFDLITDTSSIEPKIEHQIEMHDSDNESLLVAWLNELIYLLDAEQLLFKNFEIKTLSKGHLKATCKGEKFDSTKHRIKREVKAATYYMMKITADRHGYKTSIIFDI